MRHDQMQIGSPPRLERDEVDKKIAGVCSGIARYAGVDPVLVRLLFVAGALLGLSTVILYAVAWVLMPAGTVAVTVPAAPFAPAPSTPAPAAPPPPAPAASSTAPDAAAPGPVDDVA